MSELHIDFVSPSVCALKCFRIYRRVKEPIGVVVFVQGLFEELNQNRHAFKQQAEHLANAGFNSVILDYPGCGDSEGELTDVSLSLWQAYLLESVKYIKRESNLPTSLVVFGSGAITLTDEVITLCRYIQLWHPEFSGKRVLKQLSRIALLNQIPVDESQELIDASGYLIPQSMWQSFKAIPLPEFFNEQKKFDWLELIDTVEQKTPSVRGKMAQAIFGDEFSITPVIQSKYWQANELVFPDVLLDFSASQFTNKFRGS